MGVANNWNTSPDNRNLDFFSQTIAYLPCLGYHVMTQNGQSYNTKASTVPQENVQFFLRQQIENGIFVTGQIDRVNEEPLSFLSRSA
jgi:hypothetical protein|tara:strand:- start:141 stop:401 length:261 start_codon:yes stop_codon:yes gene_type:complete